MSHAISVFRWPQVPRRAGAGIVVALAHVVILIGFSAWAPNITRAIEAAPLQVSLIQQQEHTPEVWQPPQPQMMSLPVTLAPPVAEIQTEAPPPVNAITMPAPSPPPPAAGVKPTEAKTISDVSYLQPPSPRYPPESRRSREQGLVSLRVLIDELGRARDVRVERSSGFPRLDEAARTAVARAVFKPYVESGVAQPAIVIIPIEFSLNTRTARG
jgi:protein TonB